MYLQSRVMFVCLFFKHNNSNKDWKRYDLIWLYLDWKGCVVFSVLMLCHYRPSDNKSVNCNSATYNKDGCDTVQCFEWNAIILLFLFHHFSWMEVTDRGTNTDQQCLYLHPMSHQKSGSPRFSTEVIVWIWCRLKCATIYHELTQML